MFRLAGELDSNYLNEIIGKEPHKYKLNPYSTYRGKRNVYLSINYNSINQLMESDSVIKEEIFREYRDYKDYYIGHPILIHNNQSLFWYQAYWGENLIKVILVNNTNVEIIEIISGIVTD